jgi:CRP-like cAMP-binding protein
MYNNSERIAKILKKNHLFSDLENDELIQFSSFCKEVVFPKGHTIFKYNEIGNEFYLVQEGTVEVSLEVGGFKTLKLKTISSNETLGITSYFNKKIRPSKATATTEIQCILMPYSIFDLINIFQNESFITLYKKLAFELCEEITERNQSISITNLRSEATSNIPTQSTAYVCKKTSIEDKDIFSFENLKKLRFFKLFNTKDLKNLLPLCQILSVKKGRVIIKEGSTSTDFFIVIRGAVMAYKKDDNKGLYNKVGILSPGEPFGYFSYLTGNPPGVSCVTCENTILLKITIGTLDELMKSNKKIFFQVFISLINELVYLLTKTNQLLQYSSLNQLFGNKE